MICPRCQNDNPEINRFCGNCGAALPSKTDHETAAAPTTSANGANATQTVSGAAVSHYEPEGYDEEVEPKLPPEVVEYDKRVPLIAEPGTDRRHQVPKHILDEVHDFLEDINHPVNSASQDQTRPDARELREEQSARTHARVDAALNAPAPDPETQARRSNYIDLEDSRDAHEPATDRVSGPSFLGLGNSDYEYIYDDQRPSHWRRNFALLVLVVLAALAAVQWRSIRDMGLEYAKSGTVKVRVQKPGQQPQADANAANNNATNNGNGAPNLSVAPTRNADEENAKLHAEEEATKQPAQQGNNSASPAPPAVPPADTATTDNVNNTPAANNQSNNQNSANTSVPPTAPADTRPATSAANNTPSAMGAPAGSPKSTANAEEAAPSPPRSTAESHSAAEPAPKKSSARATKSTSPLVPGAFEMQQANILGQTPSAVPWLWSALGKGNPDAPVKLADMYITGRGVDKSCDQGLVILRSAAARGNARASARLGTLYATGICVPQNRVQAYEWMGTAEGRSPSLSTWAEEYRQNLWQQMTPDERARVR